MPHEWQPIETCPASVLSALLFWPAYRLDAECDLTDERVGPGLVGRGFRPVSGGAWDSAEPELEANGEWFGDDWEYGDPTHWMPLPEPPS